MPIQWRADLQIDCGRIDDDHKSLIAVINQFDNQMSHADSHATLLKLEECSKQHFASEEKVLLEMGYPEYHEHLVEHNWLSYSLSIIISSFNSPSQTCDVPMIRSRASKLLRHWLIDHIIAWDVPIRDFINNQTQAFRQYPPYVIPIYISESSLTTT